MFKNIIATLSVFALACGAPMDDEEALLGENEEAITSQISSASGSNLMSAYRPVDLFACQFNQAADTECLVSGVRVVTYCVDTNDADVLGQFSSARTAMNAELSSGGWSFTPVSCTNNPMYRFSVGTLAGSSSSNNIFDYVDFASGGGTLLTEPTPINGVFKRVTVAQFTIDKAKAFAKGTNLTEDNGYLRHVVRNAFLKMASIGNQSNSTGYYSSNTLGFGSKTMLAPGEKCRALNGSGGSITTFSLSTSAGCAVL